MNPSIYEVKQIGSGYLYVMPCPRAEMLAEDLQYFQQMNIRKIVSLLENGEAAARGLTFEEHLCQQLGMEFTQYPIPDQHTPKKIRTFHTLVEQLYAELLSGKNISIHCFAGIGRTGVLAGSLLIRDGMPALDAIDLLSRIRGRDMPQTQEQYEFLTHLDYGSAEAEWSVPAGAAAQQGRGKLGWFSRFRSTA